MQSFKYTYTTLPSYFFEKTDPTPVADPKRLLYNAELGEELGFSDSEDLTPLLSGNHLESGMTPIAQAYAGHQFGYFTMLGDGRAILLGERMHQDGQLRDVQLKGAGPTRYSRRGDGRGTLSAMLREYLISEAMFHLKIPTTRSLSVIQTGEMVQREQLEPGGILTRISKGHIRIGTFQYAASISSEMVRKLADYVIHRLYPELEGNNQYLKLLLRVIEDQASLVAKWQSVGFIHGVMNTDNMSIAGETIDYGPCAFMDTYHPKTVFSSIDQNGRYAYDQQGQIAKWNLARFAETLLSLLDTKPERALKLAETALSTFDSHYQAHWEQLFCHKIGLQTYDAHALNLVQELLDIMLENQLDFTNTYNNLMNPVYQAPLPDLEAWIKRWREHLKNKSSFEDALEVMQEVNPRIIPRNHQVEKALQAAVNGDMSVYTKLLNALQSPYDQQTERTYMLPPTPEERVLRTFCGT